MGRVRDTRQRFSSFCFWSPCLGKAIVRPPSPARDLLRGRRVTQLPTRANGRRFWPFVSLPAVAPIGDERLKLLKLGMRYGRRRSRGPPNLFTERRRFREAPEIPEVQRPWI